MNPFIEALLTLDSFWVRKVFASFFASSHLADCHGNSIIPNKNCIDLLSNDLQTTCSRKKIGSDINRCPMICQKLFTWLSWNRFKWYNYSWTSTYFVNHGLHSFLTKHVIGVLKLCYLRKCLVSFKAGFVSFFLSMKSSTITWQRWFEGAETRKKYKKKERILATKGSEKY